MSGKQFLRKYRLFNELLVEEQKVTHELKAVQERFDQALDSKDLKKGLTEDEMMFKIESARIKVNEKTQLLLAKRDIIRHNDRLLADIELTTTAIKDYPTNQEEVLRTESEKCAQMNLKSKKEIQVAETLHKLAVYKKTIALKQLFQIFFGSASMATYQPLFDLDTGKRELSRIMVLKVPEDAEQRSFKFQQVNAAIGQVVQMCMHFSRALQVPLKFPMVFNGHRSYIFSQNCLSHGNHSHFLFLSDLPDHSLSAKGIKLFICNLEIIHDNLARFRERQGIQVNKKIEKELKDKIQNPIVEMLFKIAELY